MSELPQFTADSRGRPIEVVRFVTSTGTAIFLLPLQTFPGHLNNIYLICRDGEETLFDVGSHFDATFAELLSRFEELRDRFNVSIRLEDVKRAIVSHAHIDHFGGAHQIRARNIPLWIHELDARVLTNFEERIVVASKDMAVFLRRAGVDTDERRMLTSAYTTSKEVFKSVDVDRRLRCGDILPGDLKITHVPGHCPGMIMAQVDDILLSADHILARITPNQMPQSITPFTGLENYLRSLRKALKTADDVRLALGGHEAPITNVRARIGELADHHTKRCQKILELAKTPLTIKALADALFGEQSGYGRYLAYTEAGAHVEYLNQLGELGIDNLDEVAELDHPVLRFIAT